MPQLQQLVPVPGQVRHLAVHIVHGLARQLPLAEGRLARLALLDALVHALPQEAHVLQHEAALGHDALPEATHAHLHIGGNRDLDKLRDTV